VGEIFLLSSRRFRSSREKTEQKRKRKNGPGRTLLEASKLSLLLFSSLLPPPALKKERRNRKCKRNGPCLLGWFWKCMEDRPMVDWRQTFVNPAPLTAVSKTVTAASQSLQRSADVVAIIVVFPRALHLFSPALRAAV
jgi:hypothetical protein